MPPIKVEEFPDIDFESLSYSMALRYTHEVDPQNGDIDVTIESSNNRLIFSTGSNGSKELYQQFDLKELNYRLHKCQHPDALKLRQFLTSEAGIDFSKIPELSQAEEKTFNERFARQSEALEKARKRIEEQDAIIKKTNKNHIETKGTFTSLEAFGVLQREVAITNSLSSKPVLATDGIGPCIAVAMYNKAENKAALAHIDALTDIASLEEILEKLSKGNAHIDVHLVGGDDTSRDKMVDLINLFKNFHNVSIESADLGKRKDAEAGLPRSLAIDARTGQVFSDFSKKQLVFDHGREERAMRRLMGYGNSELELTFDDSKSSWRKKELEKPKTISKEF